MNAPAAGFILFWSGVILAVLSCVVAVESLGARRGESHDFGTINWPKVFLVLAALVLYGLLLESLGFILVTFLLLSFLLAVSDEASWPMVLAVASVGSLASFTLFDLWLHIRLPKGILGF
jgi:hypothetical protein